ncbi:M48 metallopeptidase family protein [Azospirillum argentinense]|nr:M48 family metallopeptidase [Azospirillum argentinense]
MKANAAEGQRLRARRTPPYPVQNLKSRVMAWALRLRVNPKIIRVQEMRRKWGSCSSSGIVTLALDLMEQDDSFQDYVIVHELLHLRFPTHGKMFKALMTAHVPGWRKHDINR